MTGQLPRTMTAWISADKPSIQHLSLQETNPPATDDRHMRVEVHAAALNFSDLLMIDDRYQIRPPRPFTPGQEIAGIVIEAPTGSDWKPGDRIASKVLWGGFAEYAAVRTDMAIKLPDMVDFAQGAALPVVYTTAMVGLHECAAIGDKTTVLVHAAAGGIGLASIEIAKAAGARVIATAGGAEKLELARSHGADIGIDYRTNDWIAFVKDATDGRGADIIVDPVGGDVAEESLRCIARDGTLLVVGFASGTIPNFSGGRLLLKRAAAKGVYWDHDFDGEMLSRITKRMIELVKDAKINPVVNQSYTLNDLPRALSDLGNRASVGKLVLRVRG